VATQRHKLHNGVAGLIHMGYVLENPSTHFLTFNLVMEASEHFAFSADARTRGSPIGTTNRGISRTVVVTEFSASEEATDASATPSSSMAGLIHMGYVLENPSTHFLTFNLVMLCGDSAAQAAQRWSSVR
jgi:hypothetical protein